MREQAARLFTATYPLRTREIEQWAAAERAERAQRWLAFVRPSSDVAAYGSIWRVSDDRFRMDLMVDAAHREQGLGTLLLPRLLDAARSDGAATLQARAESTETPSLAFLERRGFVETMRMHRLELRVRDATLAPNAHHEAELAAARIRIVSLETLVADSTCWPRYVALWNAARLGWPDPDPRAAPRELHTAEDLERFHTIAMRNVGDGGACFIAIDGQRFVGFTGPLGTGVRPEYRGRNIATALKVRLIADARERGVEVMHSSSGSPAMLRVNEKLGFVRTSTEVRLVRRLA